MRYVNNSNEKQTALYRRTTKNEKQIEHTKIGGGLSANSMILLMTRASPVLFIHTYPNVFVLQ